MTRVFVIAGEPSGDALGAALLAGLRELDPGIVFDGIGGPLMKGEGLSSLFPMEELSVMGLAEVLPRARHLLGRIRQTAEKVIADRPDVLITIDSPDFCLRVARRVRAAAPGIRTVHYVAPTVWAWRAGRARKMARFIDQVLALLPFEPPYMEAEGMRCDFVGHPVAMTPSVSDNDIAEFRAAHHLAPEQKLLLVLPGSRMGEVGRLMPVFGAALQPVLARHPALCPVLPVAPAVADAVRAMAADWPGDPLILDVRGLDKQAAARRKQAGFAAGTAALAASGTVSLELAAARTPMVIAYDLSRLTRLIARAMVKVDTVTLVNIVTQTRVVPEFIGPDCTAQNIAGGLLDLLDDPAKQAEQRAAQDQTMKLLGQGGEAPGLRAARAVLDGLSV